MPRSKVFTKSVTYIVRHGWTSVVVQGVMASSVNSQDEEGSGTLLIAYVTVFTSCLTVEKC